MGGGEASEEPFDDNPEWTAADFARARPAHDMHSPEVAALLVRTPVGRAAAPTGGRSPIGAAALAQGPGARRDLLAA